MAREDLYTIDPPVGPFSSLDELRAWRQELAQMPESGARAQALKEVDQWIQLREQGK
jgi:hypothetical protein